MDHLEGINCPWNEFSCKNRNCLPHIFTCDGRDDCGDSSDENLPICKEHRIEGEKVLKLLH